MSTRFEKSFLLSYAKKESYEAVFGDNITAQIDVYKATLKELDNFLDAGDLTKTTLDMMGFIKNDLLKVMEGLRRLQEEHSSEAFKYIKSIDQALADLRPAKQIIFNSEEYFQSGKLKSESKEIFYSKMAECQLKISSARKAFLK